VNKVKAIMKLQSSSGLEMLEPVKA